MVLGHLAFLENSERQCTLESGITRSTIQSILHKYKFSFVQDLKNTNFQKRIHRSEFILMWSQGGETVLVNFDRRRKV